MTLLRLFCVFRPADTQLDWKGQLMHACAERIPEWAGVGYRGLPVVAVGDILAAHVTEPTEEHPDYEPPELTPVALQMQEQIEGLRLFVCGPLRV